MSKMNLSQLEKNDAMKIPLLEETETPSTYSAPRIGKADKSLMPDAKQEGTLLRRRIQEIWFEKTNGSYAQLENRAQIKQNTFQKWMNGSRDISREGLSKFAVGLTLDSDTANELFTLQSKPLNVKGNRFDFIVCCAIRDGDDIEQFAKDVLHYCGQKII